MAATTSSTRFPPKSLFDLLQVGENPWRNGPERLNDRTPNRPMANEALTRPNLKTPKAAALAGILFSIYPAGQADHTIASAADLSSGGRKRQSAHHKAPRKGLRPLFERGDLSRLRLLYFGHSLSSSLNPSSQHSFFTNGLGCKSPMPIVPIALARWRAATLCAAVHSASFLSSHHRRLARVPAPSPRSTPGSLAQRQGLAGRSLRGLVRHFPLLPHPRVGS
jgi:hypothetical protein